METVFLLLIFFFYILIRVAFWLRPQERARDRKALKEALAALAARDYPKALQLADVFLKQKPKSVEGLILRATCNYHLEEPILTIADVNRATNQDNDLPEGYLLKGKALYHMEHLDEALAEFDKAGWYSRDSPEPITWRGLVHRRMGQEAKARADFKVAAAMGDENATFYLWKTEHIGIWN
jgi:tetratricopeptide (TPR) repeat protein